MDHRIGSKFLKASVGFGGSCFKKDILNLVYLCKFYGLYQVAEYWHQIIKINDYQKSRFTKKIKKYYNGKVSGQRITILGWAFKKDTNDSRESAAIRVAFELLKQGAELYIYDPMVSHDRIFSDLNHLFENEGFGKDAMTKILSNCNVLTSIKDALKNSSSIAILTEWDEFKTIITDYDLRNKKPKIKIFDGRNILISNETIIENNIYSIGK